MAKTTKRIEEVIKRERSYISNELKEMIKYRCWSN